MFRSGKFLPRNFEKISISKLQIDQLRKRNIEYDPETGKRTDADVEGYD